MDPLLIFILFLVVVAALIIAGTAIVWGGAQKLSPPPPPPEAFPVDVQPIPTLPPYEQPPQQEKLIQTRPQPKAETPHAPARTQGNIKVKRIKKGVVKKSLQDRCPVSKRVMQECGCAPCRELRRNHGH